MTSSPYNTQAGDDLPDGLAAPARRALAGAGIVSLDDLARLTEAEVAALHGMGPKAIRILHEALTTTGRSFASVR